MNDWVHCKSLILGYSDLIGLLTSHCKQLFSEQPVMLKEAFFLGAERFKEGLGIYVHR